MDRPYEKIIAHPQKNVKGKLKLSSTKRKIDQEKSKIFHQVSTLMHGGKQDLPNDVQERLTSAAPGTFPTKKGAPLPPRTLRFNTFRQLSTKCETDNLPLCGWVTKGYTSMRGNEFPQPSPAGEESSHCELGKFAFGKLMGTREAVDEEIKC